MKRGSGRRGRILVDAAPLLSLGVYGDVVCGHCGERAIGDRRDGIQNHVQRSQPHEKQVLLMNMNELGKQIEKVILFVMISLWYTYFFLLSSSLHVYSFCCIYIWDMSCRIFCVVVGTKSKLLAIETGMHSSACYCAWQLLNSGETRRHLLLCIMFWNGESGARN